MKKITALLIALLLCSSLAGCRRVQSELKVTEAAETTEKAADTTVAAETEAPEKSGITLVMVGDVLLHERVTESGLREDGTYNFDHLFANVKEDIETADLALANQEVILGGTAIGLSGYPAFNGPQEVGDALVNAGFDVILHATNHALDRGSEGILNCIGYWKTEHPDTDFIGINESQAEQDTVHIREIDGMKIAVLNYTYGTNGIEPPYDMPYAVNYLDEDTLVRDLTYAEENADFTVVCPHWGTEYVHDPDDSQRYWADIMVQNGADLIIGTHPHVIEPVEVINNVPVFWSLGNFINSTAEEGDGVADRMLGAMAKVTLNCDESGKITVSDYEAIPLVSHVSEGTALTTYRLSDYTEELALQNLIVNQDSAFSLGYIKNLSESIFGESAD